MPYFTLFTAHFVLWDISLHDHIYTLYSTVQLYNYTNLTHQTNLLLNPLLSDVIVLQKSWTQGHHLRYNYRTQLPCTGPGSSSWQWYWIYWGSAALLPGGGLGPWIPLGLHSPLLPGVGTLNSPGVTFSPAFQINWPFFPPSCHTHGRNGEQKCGHCQGLA